MFKKSLLVSILLAVISLAWAGGFTQARERTPSPSPFKPASIAHTPTPLPGTPDAALATSSFGHISSGSGKGKITPSPTPDTTATPVPSPTLTPTLTPSPTPQSPGSSVALGFLNLFKKSDPPTTGGAAPAGLNFLSANGTGSVYQNGNAMSTAEERGLYGIVLALSLLGISTFLYGRSRHVA